MWTKIFPQPSNIETQHPKGHDGSQKILKFQENNCSWLRKQTKYYCKNLDSSAYKQQLTGKVAKSVIHQIQNNSLLSKNYHPWEQLKTHSINDIYQSKVSISKPISSSILLVILLWADGHWN